MKKILTQENIKDNEAVIMDLIKKLNQNQLTGKITLAAIIPICFPHVSSEHQQTLVT